MAYDRSEPRVGLIAKIGVVAVVALVGIKFGLDSYFVQTNEAVAAEKLPAVYEPLQKLHEGEQKNLTQSPTPISVAMAQLAQGGRTGTGGPSDITPTASDDLGPVTGWSKMPKHGLAVPSGAEIQSCKETSLKEARHTQGHEVQKHGGSIQFNDIEFAPGTDKMSAEKPVTIAALKELVIFAGACPELRFDLTGHTSKEGGTTEKNQKLSEARATSVKKAMLAAGTPEAAFGKVSGAGVTQPAVAEPEPDSDDAKRLGPEKLEAIRAANRRITMTVTTHCP